MNEPTTLSKEAWLDLHHDPKMVSASQVSTIIGENPYESAFTLGAMKLGRIPWTEENIAMRAGHAMEPVIAEEHYRQTGLLSMDEGDYAVHFHPNYPWLFATLDRVLFAKGPIESNGRGVLELKNTASWRVADEWEKGPPLMHQVQVQTQMACADTYWGALAGLALNRDFYQYPIKRDDEFIDMMLADLGTFRYGLMKDELPTAESRPAASTGATLKHLHPAFEEGKTVKLPPADAEWVARLVGLKDGIKSLEEERDGLENKLKALFGDAEFLDTGGDLFYSYRTQTRTGGVDAEAMEKAGIDIIRNQSTIHRVLRKVKRPEGM